MAAEAYVNEGRWIADCTRPHCNSAELLEPKQTAFHCSYCLQVDTVDWPANVQGITAVLEHRPVPHTRNWAPPGHRQAITSGFPDGQSVADLQTENDEHGIGGQQPSPGQRQ